MFTAEVQFTIPGSIDDAEDIIYYLLSAWRTSGQALNSEWIFTKKGNTFSTFLMLYQKNALSVRFDSRYGKLARQRLSKVCGTLEIMPLSEDPFSAKICTCKEPTFYILYTNYICLESPLRCGDCFGPLPLYKIPPVESNRGELHDHIKSWRSNYQDCDHLQMGCTVGERFGTREISNHDSNLSQQGISICNDVTEATKIATYYYLYRYNAKSLVSEKKRKCPSCGGDWLLDEPLHDLFDFKCDRCRLLSNIAFPVR